MHYANVSILMPFVLLNRSLQCLMTSDTVNINRVIGQKDRLMLTATFISVASHTNGFMFPLNGVLQRIHTQQQLQTWCRWLLQRRWEMTSLVLLRFFLIGILKGQDSFFFFFFKKKTKTQWLLAYVQSESLIGRGFEKYILWLNCQGRFKPWLKMKCHNSAITWFNEIFAVDQGEICLHLVSPSHSHFPLETNHLQSEQIFQ